MQKKITIGKHTLENNLILAPMAGVTDRPFRQLCKNLGAGMAVSEMINSNSLLYKSDKTLRRANHEGESNPKSVQIAGSNPDLMAQAAKYNADSGAQIIDINMGCPAKKICNTLAGSALLRDEELVAKIIKSVVDAVDIPVTLKIRTGWCPESRNGVTIAKIAEDLGIQALAVHGRTRNCFYKDTVEYETIAEIKQAIQIPLIANGDINNPEKAKFVLEKTGADGIMIGRAAQGRPWIFREIHHFLETGNYLAEPTNEEIKKIMIEHVGNLYDFYGEYTGVRMARKHVSWYSKGHHKGGAFRKEFNSLESAEEQMQSINAFFDRLSELV